MTTEAEWPRSTVHPRWQWRCCGGEGWGHPEAQDCVARARVLPQEPWGTGLPFLRGVKITPQPQFHASRFKFSCSILVSLMPSDSSLCSYVLNFVAFMLRSDTGFVVLVGALDYSPRAMVTFKHLVGGPTGQPGRTWPSWSLPGCFRRGEVTWGCEGGCGLLSLAFGPPPVFSGLWMCLALTLRHAGC